MGGRLLRRWLLFPLLDLARIRRRHDAVERLVEKQSAREAARKILSELGDLERLVSRARLGVASPRDLVVLGRSLQQVPDLAAALQQAMDPMATLAERGTGSDLLDLGQDLAQDIADRVVATLEDNAPAMTKEGGFIRPGVSAELDELRAIASGGRDQILAIEARERERTGIASLKVKYNSVFGYYIEITRAHLANVPADYTRKQTVANAERFVTAELADYEAKILGADERRVALEQTLFSSLRDEVGAAAWRWPAGWPRPMWSRPWPSRPTATASAGPWSMIRRCWSFTTAGIRWWNAWRPPAASCPTICTWTPSTSRS
jgi:DNA mismatch repair protein MutS